VSLSLRGTQGNVVARADTAVRFEYPDITGVDFDGETASTVDSGSGSGSGFVEVTVPAGRHAVALETS